MQSAGAILTLILLAIAVPAVAEEREFGAKFGPSFGVLTLEGDEEGYDRRISVGGGGFLALPVTRRVSVQIEALFSPKGAKLFDEDFGATSTLLLDYLEFPVLARINAARAGAFHLFGGPYMGIRTNAKRQISVVANSITSGLREDMGDEVERFDYGLVAGSGFHIGSHILLDGRYSWGLKDVNKDTSDGTRFRHRVLTVMAGVRF